MPIARNKDTGEVIFLDNGEWKPAQKAINKQTGETRYFDGKDWIGLPTAEPPMPKVTPPKEQTFMDKANEVGRTITGGARAFARGVPVIGAYADELNAATGAALDPLVPKSIANLLGIEKLPGKTFGERYQEAMRQQHAMDTGFDVKHPYASPTLQVGGGITGGMAELALLPGTAGSTLFGLGGKTLLGQMARGSASGAAMGALHGYGMGEGGFGPRAEKAGQLAAFGAVTGAAAPVVGRVVNKAITRLTGEKAPTLEALKTQAQKAYDAADNAGVIIPSKSFKPLVDKIRTDIAEAGIDATLHPKALAAFKRLEDVSDKSLTLKGVDILRRVVQGAAKSIEPDERRIAGIIRDHLDDYLMNLKSSDVMAGNAEAASSALRQARNLWSRMRKGEMVQDLVERAGNRAGQFTGSGYENALRTEFRRVSQNKKIMRTLSLTEQSAIRKVARGGPIANSLRMLGKFAPRGVVSTTLSGGAGYAVGGPVGSAAMLGAGEIGRHGATLATKRAARIASELMRRGGSVPTAPGATEGEMLSRALLQFSGPARNRLMLEWMRNQFPDTVGQ